MPLIEVLYVSETDLSALSVSACKRMRKLYCSDTSIALLQVSHMLDLEYLAVDGTAITSITVVGLPKMKKVWGCDEERRDVKTGPGVERC